MSPFSYLAVLIFLLTPTSLALAQEPSLAPSNMEFTQKIIAKFHYMASVDFGPEGEPSTHYQYDHYPEGKQERLKTGDGVFARQKGKSWLQSDDWGETGKPVAEELAEKLDTYVSVVQAQFSVPNGTDTSQGGTVWKFIEKTADKEATYFTYERTREHPHPDGVYPRFTFLKAGPDIDGHLFMCGATGNLRSGEQRFPYTVHLRYLIPVPADSKVVVFDKDTGKKKYQATTGKNSGWEVTSQQSTPPTE